MFNIYYINFPKVYELKMMLSNLISISKEVQTESSTGKEIDYVGKLGIKFLNMFNGEFGVNRNTKNGHTNKVLETFEIKTTKSIILSEILNNSKESKSFDDIKEGDLVRVDGVQLTLENEAELRMVKVFMNGNVKGLIPDSNGVDVSSLINSLVKDYSYKLKGSVQSGGLQILMKVPMSFENEFESSYGVDDLFIGKVGVVGMYRGIVKMSSLRNSFEFFQEISNKSDMQSSSAEIRPSQHRDTSEIENSLQASTSDHKNYHYIDLLAIYQNIGLPGKI